MVFQLTAKAEVDIVTLIYGQMLCYAAKQAPLLYSADG